MSVAYKEEDEEKENEINVNEYLHFPTERKRNGLEGRQYVKLCVN